jgi:hypothetical protein
MSGLPGNSYAFATDRNRIGDATAAIWHQRHEEQHAMKTPRKRTVTSRALGAGLVIGGAALSAVLLTGAQAPQVSANAHLGDRLWINTDDVTTVGTTSANPLPVDGRGNTIVGLPGFTIVGLPGPSVAIPNPNAPANTVVGLPGVPSIGLPGGNGPGNTFVWFPGGSVVTGSSFVS